MPDERVDLPQREGRDGPTVEVTAQEAVGGHAEFKRGGGGLFGDGGTVLPGEGEDAENAADAGGAVVAVDVVTDRSDGGTGPLGGGEQGEGLGRRPGGPVLIGDAMPAAGRAQVLAKQFAGAGVEQPDVGPVPLDVDAAADPARRCGVVGRGDLDAAVEMHGALAVLVVAKRFERQSHERRALFGKHGGDLALGGAVDAGVSPAPLPAVQIRLGVVEALEAQTVQRGFLRVADAGLDLALAVGVADAARQGDGAVVGQHVAVERIERRVVDVRGEDALLEVVEHDDADTAAQPPECALVQLGPEPGARPVDQQPHGLARVAEREHEEPRPSVLARGRVADHRPAAVVDLRLLARSGRDDHPGLGGGALSELGDETPHTGIAGRKAVRVDQLLPDGHGVAAAVDGLDDQLAVRFAGAGPRRRGGVVPGRGDGRTRARARRRCHRRVGGHLRRNGRFCCSSGRSAATPHYHARRLQVTAGRLAADPGGPLDPPQRPPEASQRQDLLSFVFCQDVAHAGQELAVPDRCQRLGPLSLMAGFQVSTNGRHDQRRVMTSSGGAVRWWPGLRGSSAFHNQRLARKVSMYRTRFLGHTFALRGMA